MDEFYLGAHLTNEQVAICSSALDMLHSDRGMLKVSAGAACGKTTTLIAIARQLHEISQPALYLTFNNALREHARPRFSANTEVSTVHSQAFRWAKSVIGSRKAGSISVRDVESVMGFGMRAIPFSNPRAYAGVLLQTIGNFASSPEHHISERHLPYSISQVDFAGDVLRDAAELYARVQPGANTRCRVPHDLYLKEWALQGAPGLADYPIVLVDEGQDWNGAMLSALSYAQRVVMVGDSNQQLYSFRGAMGLLERIPAPELLLSTSFRFGQELAVVANSILDCKRLRTGPLLRGFASKHTLIGTLDKSYRSHTRIFRSGYELAHDALTLHDTGTAFTLAGSWRELSDKLLSANALRVRQRDSVLHPAISPYGSWSELVDAANEREDADLLSLVGLVSELRSRTTELAGLLSDANRKDIAPVHLTTASRAKGLEWRNVVVRSDFDPARERVARPGKSTAEHDVEQNMLYVAATRASEAVEFHCSTERLQSKPAHDLRNA